MWWWRHFRCIPNYCRYNYKHCNKQFWKFIRKLGDVKLRVFKVPFDIKREEKIFGGYLSLRQVIYIMLGASSLSLLATPLPIILKVLFIFLIAIFFLLCAFLKVKEQYFDKFFFYAIKYLFRKKNFVYERCSKW